MQTLTVGLNGYFDMADFYFMPSDKKIEILNLLKKLKMLSGIIFLYMSVLDPFSIYHGWSGSHNKRL